MNAIILYENFDLATSARDMLSKAAHRADGELRWTIKSWRLDVLLQPPSAEAALEEAADTHLIVLAMRNPTECSPGLLDRLEQWARGRQVGDGALALYDGGNGDAPSATTSPELARFAQRHGMSFILDDLHAADASGCS